VFLSLQGLWDHWNSSSLKKHSFYASYIYKKTLLKPYYVHQFKLILALIITIFYLYLHYHRLSSVYHRSCNTTKTAIIVNNSKQTICEVTICKVGVIHFLQSIRSVAEVYTNIIYGIIITSNRII